MSFRFPPPSHNVPERADGTSPSKTEWYELQMTRLTDWFVTTDGIEVAEFERAVGQLVRCQEGMEVG